MNYAKYISCDDANGEGIRCSLFVSGCTHKCKGCFNKPAWKFNYGDLYTQEIEDRILEDLSNPYINGLSLLGGEPLHHRNLNPLITLCKKVKQLHPEKDIWVWSGYTLQQITTDSKKFEILKYIDKLIDGKYEEDLRDPDLKWKGSSNQNLICIRRLDEDRVENSLTSSSSCNTYKEYTLQD